MSGRRPFPRLRPSPAGARQTGHSVEKIFLKDRKINYCGDCETCLNGKKPCPQKSDMAEVLKKMVAADVIAMATPVYFYTMNAQMKTLDRPHLRPLRRTQRKGIRFHPRRRGRQPAGDGKFLGWFSRIPVLFERPQGNGRRLWNGSMGPGRHPSQTRHEGSLRSGRGNNIEALPSPLCAPQAEHRESRCISLLG